MQDVPAARVAEALCGLAHRASIQMRARSAETSLAVSKRPSAGQAARRKITTVAQVCARIQRNQSRPNQSITSILLSGPPPESTCQYPDSNLPDARCTPTPILPACMCRPWPPTSPASRGRQYINLMGLDIPCLCGFRLQIYNGWNIVLHISLYKMFEVAHAMRRFLSLLLQASSPCCQYAPAYRIFSSPKTPCQCLPKCPGDESEIRHETRLCRLSPTEILPAAYGQVATNSNPPFMKCSQILFFHLRCNDAVACIMLCVAEKVDRRSQPDE